VGSDLARRSSRELRTMFRAADCPELAAVTGRFAAELAGPAVVRVAAPIAFRLTGLGDWWGKELRLTDDGTALTGFNLAGPRGERTTLPLHARIAPSRLDGAPALVVGYGADAPLPWRRVVDDLRLHSDGTIVALTFGLPLTARDGAPFLLRRESSR